MTANTGLRLSVQTLDGSQTFGVFKKEQSGEQDYWTLSGDIARVVLSSGSCCSSQVRARVVASNDRHIPLAEEEFSISLSFCEAFCCGTISIDTFDSFTEEIKTVAANVLTRSNHSVPAENIRVESLRLSSFPSAQDFLRSSDMSARLEDPTPFSTGRSHRYGSMGE